jgi:hypothetical protein
MEEWRYYCEVVGSNWRPIVVITATQMIQDRRFSVFMNFVTCLGDGTASGWYRTPVEERFSSRNV